MRATKYRIFRINIVGDLGKMIELFDGPGTLSPNIFMNNQEPKVTSTFQLIIHLWMPSTKIVSANCSLRFVTIAGTVNRIIEIYHPWTHKISHIVEKSEIWKILSHYNLKIAIINLTYSGDNDAVCTFAGITPCDLSTDSYREITTECFSIEDSLTYRNIYSKSNDTLLVLYSYRKYGNLSITIQLSITQCKPVTVNTCALTYLCQFPNNTMCKDHREQIRSLNITNMQISIDFPISMNPGQCFILQMVALIDRLTLLKNVSACKINFRHIDISSRKMKILFNIRAFFHDMACKYFDIFEH